MALASFSTIAPIVSILTDTIEDVSMREPLKNYQRYTARLTILGMGTVIARLTWNYLGYFESIMGGVCSISISLLLPILFYAKLYICTSDTSHIIILLKQIGVNDIHGLKNSKI